MPPHVRNTAHQPEEAATATTAPRPGPFAALRHRDYRLLLSGEFIATLGQQMQTVAITYQVYQLHHSAVELGLLGLVRLIPVLVFSLAGGVWRIRWIAAACFSSRSPPCSAAPSP